MSDDVASMANAFRAKSTGARRSGSSGPKPSGAVLGVGAPSPFAGTGGPATPVPTGADLAVGDGLGHMGAWADKEHPTV